MKKVSNLLICILLLVSSGCQKSPETLKPQELQRRIADILSDENLSVGQKGLEILPYMVDKAVSCDSQHGLLKIRSDYEDYLRAGADFLRQLPNNELLDDNSRRQLSEELKTVIVQGKLSPRKTVIYGSLYYETLLRQTVPKFERLSEAASVRWSESQRQAIVDSAGEYRLLLDKLNDDNFLSAEVEKQIARTDPWAYLVMQVQLPTASTDSSRYFRFLNQDINEYSANPLLFLSLQDFFDQRGKTAFYEALADNDSLTTALYYYSLIDKPEYSEQFALYCRANEAAMIIAQTAGDPRLTAIIAEYQESRNQKFADLNNDKLKSAFPHINYSGIKKTVLLQAPQEVWTDTYILAVNAAGNKKFNNNDTNYTELVSYLSGNNEYLKQAPLQYAQYLLAVDYYNEKTSFYYQDTQNGKKTPIYHLRGDLLIYRRGVKKPLYKLHFDSQKPPNGTNNYQVNMYAKPSIKLAEAKFYEKLAAALLALKSPE